MEESMNYPPIEEILQQVVRHNHHLWTACRFIRDNPGCKADALEDHLDRTYPSGPRGRFSWILGWAGTRRTSSYATEIGLYQRLYKREGKRSRGFHLLQRGEEIAAMEEPPFKPEPFKRMPNGWVTDDLPPGTMLVSRQRTRSVYAYSVTTSQTHVVAAGDFVLFHGFASKELLRDKRSLRVYGEPYLYARLQVLHNDGTLCEIEASRVKPLWGKGGKRADS